MIILCNWNPLALHSAQTRQLYLVVLQMIQRASKRSKAPCTDVLDLFKSQCCRADTFHHLLSFKEVLQLMVLTGLDSSINPTSDTKQGL